MKKQTFSSAKLVGVPQVPPRPTVMVADYASFKSTLELHGDAVSELLDALKKFSIASAVAANDLSDAIDKIRSVKVSIKKPSKRK